LIRLDALDDADAATLLDHLAPELPPGVLRSRILSTAEGNPLFVEQFVAYEADEIVAGQGILDERTAIDLPIPPTIEALLAARLDRVPDGERRLLERSSRTPNAARSRAGWPDSAGVTCSAPNDPLSPTTMPIDSAIS
jgi:predicted ATPase